MGLNILDKGREDPAEPIPSAPLFTNVGVKVFWRSVSSILINVPKPHTP
jgi:hypothetical protein